MKDLKEKENKIEKIDKKSQSEFNTLAERELLELKETSKENEDIKKEIMQEIEKMDLDENVKQSARQHATDIGSLQREAKIKKLIALARTKGVIFAINVAKKMNDPYVLDTLHDMLAKEGMYKQFRK